MKNIIYQVLFLLFFSFLSFSQEQVKLLTSTKFNNGEQIPEAKTASEWEQLSMSNQPVFMKKVIVGKEYFFYNWYAISDKRQLVDEKWIIPNSNELLIWNAYSPISVQPIGIISEQGAFTKVTDQQYFWTSSEYTDKGKRESAISANISKTTIGETSLNQAYKQEGFFVLIVEREAIKVASKTLVETYLKSKKNNEPIKTVVSSPIPKTIKESNKSIEDTNKPAIQWVTIPAGTFTMGSPSSEVKREDDEIQHEVTLGVFKMSAYEVTFEQYDAFCEETMRTKPNDQGWGRGKRPVINVSWNDATAFAEWMGCRLPTEAEWEYACRAGSITPFNTGKCLITSFVNYDANEPYNNCIKGDYEGKTLPVGSYAPNKFGLYDMHGNVLEWCSDFYGKYSTNNQTNPTGISFGTFRVIRGGSFLNGAQYCRSANRRNDNPGYRTSNLGFRLVTSE